MPLNRREFMAAAAAAAAASALPVRAEATRPNVIFAFGDEHRYQSMGFTETPGLHTPAMDRMAREGVSFRNCISNYPVCSPFRAMLLTGQWPQQNGVTDNNIPLPPDGHGLGDAFRGAGYRTGYIGKWHLGGTRAEDFGFDTSLIWTNTNTHCDASTFHPAGEDPQTPKGYNATLMMDQAVTFCEHGGDAPFFLALSLNPPHAHFLDAPEAFRARYPKDSLPVRANAILGDGDQGGALDVTHAAYNGYHAHVSALDHELGRLIAALEAQGILENTILVYSSDHGSMLGSHGVGSKRQPYEESIRIPFLVLAPGRYAPQPERTELIGAIDFMPTLLGAAGITPPESCAGQDFSPHFRGASGPAPEVQPIMHIAKDNASKGNEHPAPVFRGLRGTRFTYAAGAEGPLCFFDNAADPCQRNNLVAVEARHDEMMRWHARTRDHFTAMGDTFFEDAAEV